MRALSYRSDDDLVRELLLTFDTPAHNAAVQETLVEYKLEIARELLLRRYEAALNEAHTVGDPNTVWAWLGWLCVQLEQPNACVPRGIDGLKPRI